MASGTIKTGTETQSGTIGQLAGGDVGYYWDKTHHIAFFNWGATGTRPSDGNYDFSYPSGLKPAIDITSYTRDKAGVHFGTNILTITVWASTSGPWDIGNWTIPTK